MNLKLSIDNFQSIKHVDLEAEVGDFVCVIGKTDIGKSAIIRSVRGLQENTPVKSELRKGEKTLSVKLQMPSGNIVQWEKGKSSNDYVVNGERLSKVGNNVPSNFEEWNLNPVKTSVGEYNLIVRGQFDSPFLIDDSRGMVSLIEKLGDFQKYNRACELCKQKVKQDETEAKKLETESIDLEEEIDRYSPIDLLKESIIGFDKVKKESESKEKIFIQLSSIKDRYYRILNEIQSLNEKINILLPIISISIDDIERKEQDLVKISVIRDKYKSLYQETYLIFVRNKALSLIESISFDEIESLYSKKKLLLDIQEKFKYLDYLINKTEKQLVCYSGLDNINISELESIFNRKKELKEVSDKYFSLIAVKSIELPEIDSVNYAISEVDENLKKYSQIKLLKDKHIILFKDTKNMVKKYSDIEKEIAILIKEMPKECPICGNELVVE